MEEGYGGPSQKRCQLATPPRRQAGGRRGRTCAAQLESHTSPRTLKQGSSQRNQSPSVSKRPRGRPPTKCPVCKKGKREARIHPCQHVVCRSCAYKFHNGDGFCGVNGCEEYAENIEEF